MRFLFRVWYFLSGLCDYRGVESVRNSMTRINAQSFTTMRRAADRRVSIKQHMNSHFYTILFVWSLLPCVGAQEVSPRPPRNWKSAAHIDFGSDFSRLKLSHNTPEAIRQEILDTNTIRLIAKSGGLTDEELRTLRVAQEPGYNWVQVYQVGNSDRAFTALSERLRNYVRAREEGHTRAFVLAALTNRASSSTLNGDLQAIATNRALLPLSWLKKAESGTTTNKAGRVASHTISTAVVNGKTVTNEVTHIPQVDEVCRWVSYTLVDGEIAWRYFVKFKADGSLDYVHDRRCDAKEYQPKYQKIIKDVEDEIRGEMKRDGSFGKFGSVHTFWHLKKEKLKTRGIEWKSPSDLNPNSNFD
jgi:hypothetical protein